MDLLQPPIQQPIQSQNNYQQPFIGKQLNPNDKLDLCCRKKGVSPVCQKMCNFDTFTERSVNFNLKNIKNFLKIAKIIFSTIKSNVI